MLFKDIDACVTGGAGFIGSSMTDALLERGCGVTVIDDLSAGDMARLAKAKWHETFRFVKGDVRKPDDLDRALPGCKAVVHLAANPEVRGTATEVHLEQNVLATHKVLEGMRRNDVPFILFASTSTVYGEADKVPTPEDYGPCNPISFYGASKLACEAMISSYCHLYGLRAVSMRLANVVGPRSGHGVLFDFVRKLRTDPSRLEVLGDGTQTKSYIHIGDCVDGFVLAAQRTEAAYDVYNMGSADRVPVKRIAELVIEEMGAGCKDARIEYTGGVDGGRGWAGDVKVMQLGCDKLRKLGWKPEHGSEESLRMTLRGMLGKEA